jgi:peptidyl-prolyl cis-trans isomerase D
MMSKLREYTKTILWVVIVAFIGTIIFAWGKGGFRGDGKDRDLIGEVEGYEVRSREFFMLYDQLYRQVLDEKGEVTDEEEEHLRETTWAQIMNEILVQRWIEDLGLEVTDQELVEAIKSYPPQEWIQDPPEWVATEGEFDYDKYIQLLASDDPMVVQQLFVPLEHRYRRRLIIDKVQRLVASSSRTTTPEVQRSYIDNHEKVRVRYIFVKAEEFQRKEGEITEEEIRSYYLTNKDKKFTHGESANLKYVQFAIEPTSAESDSVRRELQEIAGMIRSGEDFAQLAAAYSEHPSAANGGDLGWLSQGPGSGQLEEVAFSLEVGEISEPFQMARDWQILKVTDRKREQSKEGKWETLVRASTILLKVQPSQTTRELVYGRAQDFLGRASEENFEELAGEFDQEVKESGVFTPGPGVPGIGQNQEINDFAFSSKEGTVSPVYHGRNAYYVCLVFERIKAGYIPFDEVKDRIKEVLTYRRQADMAAERARSIQDEIAAGGTLSRVAREHGYEVQETPYFTRLDRVKGVGKSAEFFVAAFHLSKEKPIRVAKTDLGGYLLEFVDRTPADMEAFPGESEALRAELQKKAQDATMNHWYVYIIEQGDIKDYRSRFFGG